MANGAGGASCARGIVTARSTSSGGAHWTEADKQRHIGWPDPREFTAPGNLWSMTNGSERDHVHNCKISRHAGWAGRCQRQ
eukprot:7044496-Pyramimonas_sp.AAC.2